MEARRNIGGLLGGSWVSSFPGQGLLFHEPRKYVPGEPARRIDWNITARLQKPYVRVHLEERQREVFIALDVSPSMHVGTQEKTKLECAVEIAATLAVSAIDNGDRLAHVVFADRVLEESRPRGGRKQLFRVLRSLLDHSRAWQRPVQESDPRVAIHAIQRHRGRRFVVFLISDFIDHDVPDDLKYVRARHDVSLLHVYDPLELAAVDGLVFRGYATEGAAQRSTLAAADAGSLEETSGFLRRKSARYGISVASFSTAEPIVWALDDLFYRKRRRRS